MRGARDLHKCDPPAPGYRSAGYRRLRIHNPNSPHGAAPGRRWIKKASQDPLTVLKPTHELVPPRPWRGGFPIRLCRKKKRFRPTRVRALLWPATGHSAYQGRASLTPYGVGANSIGSETCTVALFPSRSLNKDVKFTRVPRHPMPR